VSFNDIKGQDNAIKFLKTAIRNEKIPHAYLLAGPRGCGRSLLAKNFAKAVNCVSIDRKDIPCDSCLSCKKIDKGIHPDVKWIGKDERSGQIKIDQIRELENQIVLRPYEGKYKIFIIIDAELMNVEAANSFLKTLEEPPQNSLLILIAERVKDLLPTITSRCQMIRVRPLEINELASILISEHGIPGQKAKFLSRISEGRLGRAISYRYDIFGWRDSVLDEFSNDECIEDYGAENRGELSKKLNVLTSWYRDILVFKTTQDENLLINADRIADIKKIANSYKVDELMRTFDNVLNTKERIENNVNPKLALSVLFKATRASEDSV
jgi:DNA polymerase-3 subunit delta'